ncbi:ABC-three component system protein [Paraburkholderia bannensis]|uniref:ABC-three component system protein n=1 Tax=Paraburkholderia bannensis TaxID=765414 RepID=UPI002AC329C3|nr:ABC-three component system protein [Paraburkholderia bannensis]
MTTSNKSVKKNSNPRPHIGNAFEVSLCTEVNQACPNCGNPLFISKSGKRWRNYEIAHIYPLNPTAQEINLLKGEKRLSIDPNHEDNLIPLCFPCHNIYDNPKTVAGYRDLVKKKENIIRLRVQQNVFSQYHLEIEISKIIESLCKDDAQFDESPLNEAKRVDDKLDTTITPFAKRKIKNDVTSFYLFVRDRFADLERSEPGKAVLIAHQVKTFYLKQKTLSTNQQEIFENVVSWIKSKHSSSSETAAEVIAAFYVQNCELFE